MEKENQEQLLADVRSKLSPFLKSHTFSDVEKHYDVNVRIARPWGDAGLELLIDAADEPVLDALNSVYLPPSLAAVWHKDSRDLEFFLEAVETDQGLESRKFKLDFRGRTYSCEFADSSERLLQIAEASRGLGETERRALAGYYMHRHHRKEHPDTPTAKTCPRSFWIKDVEWNEQAVGDLVRHINYYSYYFDRQTPLLPEIWLTEEAAGLPKPPRYPRGEFPAEIGARMLDPYLLSLWRSSLEGNPRLRFLYAFQAVEYAAFYFIKDEVYQAVRRLLMAPDVQARCDETAHKIMDVLVSDRVQDEDRIRTVIQKNVEPSDLWKEIQPLKRCFAKPVSFDGGFEVGAILEEACEVDDFRSMWFPKIPNTLIQLRNALVHGRESRMGLVMAPTRAWRT